MGMVPNSNQKPLFCIKWPWHHTSNTDANTNTNTCNFEAPWLFTSLRNLSSFSLNFVATATSSQRTKGKMATAETTLIRRRRNKGRLLRHLASGKDATGLRYPSKKWTRAGLVVYSKETDEQNHLSQIIEQGVAEGSSEIPKGETVPLEYNLVGLNAISFDKGCYVGQELIAQTHHGGVIRKRVVPLKFINEVENKVIPGSEVINTASSKKAGTVTTALGCCGLGLLRLDNAFKGPIHYAYKDKRM
ncbi:hypothetical protein PIB30_074780 [Stylosanthes scabra]|uniref:CAF17 C-terminal domain-containing protein n=1 Tax=Stylosanthes scabra TaxID=79078 RepID=A0ABU6VT45_9FABA|nr:hypothetical protein [Stylosanthes scabra]